MAVQKSLDVEKSVGYYSNPRLDVLSLVSKKCKRVLDIGCGYGALGKELKERGVEEVAGIEINSCAAQIASRCLDRVIEGDADKVNLSFEEGYFDCIIYADILEHLVNPWWVLSKHKKFLADDGRIIISIPNVRHIHVILNLLIGKWEYADRGIFDKLHLRFFTLKSIVKALNDAGYEVDIVKRNYRLFEDTTKCEKIARLISCYFFRDFFAFQYLITACKKSQRLGCLSFKQY